MRRFLGWLILGAALILAFYIVRNLFWPGRGLRQASDEALERASSRLAREIAGVRRIVVMPIEAPTWQSQDAERLTRFLQGQFLQGGDFIVVERAELERVMQELKVQHSGVVDARTAKELGKVLGADAVVLGSVSRYDDALEETEIGITLKAIDVERGIVLASVSENVTAQGSGLRSGAQALGRSAQKSEAGKWWRDFHRRADRSPALQIFVYGALLFALFSFLLRVVAGIFPPNNFLNRIVDWVLGLGLAAIFAYFYLKVAEQAFHHMPEDLTTAWMVGGIVLNLLVVTAMFRRRFTLRGFLSGEL